MKKKKKERERSKIGCSIRERKKKKKDEVKFRCLASEFDFGKFISIIYSLQIPKT
jgi:hypothetical protein